PLLRRHEHRARALAYAGGSARRRVLGAGATEDRPGSGTRPAGVAADGLAGGAAAGVPPVALPPRAGPGGRRVPFEGARAQCPALERLASANAGTNGPLPRSAGEAMRAQLARDLENGRSGPAWLDELLARREEARRGLAAVLGVDPALVALVDS